MERNEFINFIVANLGKEVIVKNNIGMLVGYNLAAKLAIVSFTKVVYDINNLLYTWTPVSLEPKDIILIHSPLNVSYYYVSEIKLLDNYEYRDR